MTYKTLSSAFHDPSVDEDALYKERYESDAAVHIGVDVFGYPSFFVMTPEIFASVVRATRADKEILRLASSLPAKALEQFAMNNLIDEIVITNEIEGVNSTRREIGEVLDNLKKNDKKMRFRGLVNKYLMLNADEWSEITTPFHIREAYDELVLEEVKDSNMQNAPDGDLFRKGSVSIYDAAQKEIHRGVMPESAIIDGLSKSLLFLNEHNSCEPLARVAAFHFLFGYIHPFYDGNGRVNRFISSQYIAKICEPVAGYGLSYTIKDRLQEYYKAFTTCEGSLARGDITPFVITFADMLAASIERIQKILQTKKNDLNEYGYALSELLDNTENVSAKARDMAFVLLQATLFTADGITVRELMEATEIKSRNTFYKKMKEVESVLSVIKTKIGKELHMSIKTDEIAKAR